MKKSIQTKRLVTGLSALAAFCFLQGCSDSKEALPTKPTGIKTPAETPILPSVVIKPIAGEFSTSGLSCWKDSYQFAISGYSEISNQLQARKYAFVFSNKEMKWQDFLNMLYASSVESSECSSTHTSSIEYLSSTQFKIVSTATDCHAACSQAFCDASRSFAREIEGQTIEFSLIDKSLGLKMLEESDVCSNADGDKDSLLSVGLSQK